MLLFYFHWCPFAQVRFPHDILTVGGAFVCIHGVRMGMPNHGCKHTRALHVLYARVTFGVVFRCKVVVYNCLISFDKFRLVPVYVVIFEFRLGFIS